MKDLTNSFINEIKSLINSASQRAIRAVDFERVKLYWSVGKRIV